MACSSSSLEGFLNSSQRGQPLDGLEKGSTTNWELIHWEQRMPKLKRGQSRLEARSCMEEEACLPVVLPGL